MIKHIVVFDFSGITADQEVGLTKAMYNMMGKIPELKSLSFGRNISERSKTYTHALLEEFEDMEAVGRYLVHPIHEQLLEDYVKPLCKDRAIVDYVVD